MAMNTDNTMLAALVLAMLASLLSPGGEQSPDGLAGEGMMRGGINAPQSAFVIPDFAAYPDVREKKREFFNFMLPMIREANEMIKADRAALVAMRNQLLHRISLDTGQSGILDRIARRYRVPQGIPDQDKLAILLTRVDIVPASLALAQSANESGWGTSRFAREANNLFGVWCFRAGCGLIPKARNADSTHEVARYDSVQQSVSDYIHTINTNPAYSALRARRSEFRHGNLRMCGITLAEGLSSYSARGQDYVREIQRMIRANNLQRYNLPGRA